MIGSKKPMPDGLMLNASSLSRAKAFLYVGGFHSLFSTNFEFGLARQKDIDD